MLSGKSGADVATISDKLDWQQHTTRAALTHLRKAGYNIAAEKPADGKPARCWITVTPETVLSEEPGLSRGRALASVHA